MSAEAKSIHAPVPKVVRGKPCVLHADKNGEQIVYPHGKNIIVRKIANPLDCYIYSLHAVATTAAAFAPSGYYVCSGDKSGTVHIWDTTQDTHAKKYEYKALGGPILDIAWSPDSKRIVVVGEGRESFGNVFLWDSGSSCGSITGHAKSCNSVDMKSTRPFRLVTASEDTDAGFFAGPPFKWDHMCKESAGYVNAVRYSPSGEFFLTGDSKGRAFLYDGKEGTLVAELGGAEEGAHKGGIYGVSWSPDSKSMLTASADKTVKMWDVETRAVVTTFTFGEALEAQQLGCLWAGEHMMSVSLAGVINLLDADNAAAPKAFIRGNVENIDAMTVDATHIYAGSYDAVSRIDRATGAVELFANAPKGSVRSIAVAGDSLIVTGGDDTVSVSAKSGDALGPETTSLESAPQGSLANAGSDMTVVASIKHLVVLSGGKVLSQQGVDYETTCAAMMAGDKMVAVGAADKKVRVYEINGDTLTETKALEQRDPITAVAFSPDGAYLAAADASRTIVVYKTDDWSQKVATGKWRHHQARVNCIAWCPDSQHMASGGLDTNLIVWDVENQFKRIKVVAAHPAASVTSVAWADETTLYSAGLDSTIRSWSVTHV